MFEEDQLIRAEKHRKHQLYKKMLDQQLRYKQTHQQRTLFQQPRTYQSPPHALPHIRQSHQYKPQPYHQAADKNNNLDIYVRGCEEIKANLRELGQRQNKPELSSQRKKEQPPPYYFVEERDYFPKRSYFVTPLPTSTPFIAHHNITSNHKSNKSNPQQKNTHKKTHKSSNNKVHSVQDPQAPDSKQPTGLKSSLKQKILKGGKRKKKPSSKNEDHQEEGRLNEEERSQLKQLRKCLEELTLFLKKQNSKESQNQREPRYSGKIRANTNDRSRQNFENSKLSTISNLRKINEKSEELLEKVSSLAKNPSKGKRLNSIQTNSERKQTHSRSITTEASPKSESKDNISKTHLRTEIYPLPESNKIIVNQNEYIQRLKKTRFRVEMFSNKREPTSP